jgi:hypothetical protein
MTERVSSCITKRYTDVQTSGAVISLPIDVVRVHVFFESGADFAVISGNLSGSTNIKRTASEKVYEIDDVSFQSGATVFTVPAGGSGSDNISVIGWRR